MFDHRQWPVVIHSPPRAARHRRARANSTAYALPVLRGGLADVSLATALGLLVGLVEVDVRRMAPRYGVFLPGAASFGMALTVLLAERVVDPVPNWARWVGVALFGVGVAMHDSAKPRSMR